MAYLSEHCAFAHLTEDLATRLQGFSCEQEPAIADFFRDEAVLNERNGFVTLFKDEKTEKEYRGIYGRKPLRTRFMTYDLTLMKL